MPKRELSDAEKGICAKMIVKFEKENIIKITKTMFGQRAGTAKKFESKLDSFYKEKYSGINKLTSPVVNTFGDVMFPVVADEIKYKESGGAEFDKFMDEYTEAFNLRYISTSKNRLNNVVGKALEEGSDPVVAVENQFEKFEETRPETVSLKETIKIAGAVSLFVYGFAGITKTVWVTAGTNPCDFCKNLSGKVISIGKTYKDKDDVMNIKGNNPMSFSSNIMHPPLHGGCVCQIMPG